MRPYRHSTHSKRSPGYRPNPKQSYSTITVSESAKKFLSGIPVDPSPRILLEKGSNQLTMRAMDLICPIGMGQRGLIVAPPGSGKTTFLKHICLSIIKAYPEVKLFCLLVDERPEEVTEFKRSIPCAIHSSSSDESYDHHIQVADKLMAEAYKLAGEGQNVVIIIDSLTRLSRVHNAERQSSGRTLSGGVDARSLEVPRRIFGSARKIENGGSLTILASILVETGSRMDEVIFEEFKGTGNMEIVLSREIASHRIFPAIDIKKSATRKQELLLESNELMAIENLRKQLAILPIVQAIQQLVDLLNKYPTNQELLRNYQKV